MIIRGYPNYSDEIPTQKADLTKWIEALKQIHIRANLGHSKLKATDELIKNWDRMEQRNFKDWMKFYESGDANKYKMAQMSYYVNDSNGYFLPNPQSKIPSPIKSINDQIAAIPQEAQTIVQQKPNELPQDEKRRIVEDQRRRLIGRLNAAEKLLTSHQGQIFAGSDFEKLLNAIYDLKRQVQTINKINLSAETCTDLIIRQANILMSKGSEFGSQFMMKLAQGTPGNLNFGLGDTPAGGSIPQGQGAIPNNDPTMDMLTATPPAKADDKAPAKDDKEEDVPDGGIDGFLANMEGSGITYFDDKNEVEDELMVGDIDDMNDVLDQDIDMGDADDLVVEAQMMPQIDKELLTEPRKSKPIEKEKSVKIDPITPDLTMPDQDKVGNTGKDVDAILESAFAGITTQDIVDKLEDVANIFRNREISRQLALVDMMMDRLGIGQYFSELNEAQNKALDVNSYCLTRIDSMLSRLKGASQTNELDLQGKNNAVAPQAQGLASSLDKADKEEKHRKEMKKQLDTQQTAEKLKPTPEVENVGEDLGAEPLQIEQPTPPKQQKPALAPTI